SGGIVSAPPSRWCSAETSLPSGWLLCNGCSSCWGSPSSTMLLPAAATASTFDRDILPRFVDDQHVYALPEVLSRPAPRGCADNVHAAVLDAAANRDVVALVLD